MHASNLAPAVVTYMSSSALAIVRALGRRRIPVYAIDSRPDPDGRGSRYCEVLRSPDVQTDEEGFIRFLLDLGRRLPQKGVLYPTGDTTVVPISRHRKRLARYYRFVLPQDEVLQQAVSKRGLDQLTARFGVPAPKTLFPGRGDDISELADEISYPALLKPTFSPRWRAPAMRPLVGHFTKAVRVDGPSDLVAAYDLLSAVDDELIVQELIPGDDDQLFYVCFYCDRGGDPAGMFVGQKVRIYPIHFGSASFVRSCHQPQLLATTTGLLRGMRYRGLGGIEFKRDARDGVFKLIEFNARFGLWDALGTRFGIDLPYMAYRDALGLSVERRLTYPAGAGWVDFQRDLAAFRAYRDEGQLSMAAWLRSLTMPVMASVFAADDPAPFFAFGAEVVRRKLRRHLPQLARGPRPRSGRGHSSAMGWLTRRRGAKCSVR